VEYQMKLILANLLLLPFASASVTKINEYEPDTIMTDQTAMDLDQNAIIFHLILSSDSGYETAKAIYDNGSYSDTYGVLQLGANSNVGGIPKGTKISGMSTGGADIIGEAYEGMAAGNKVLKFRYPVFDMAPPNHVGCIVGKLPEAWQTTGGCLQEAGTITIDGVGVVSYTYAIASDTMNGRSFKGWSADAEKQMSTCSGGCPYSDFSKFKTYYGQADYADEWTTAALEGRTTNFANLGGADFSIYGYTGRTQAVMKATSYITDPMITIRQLEYALDLCKGTEKDASVRAWDEGVAFYHGSMALGDPGILMYALAEKRCKNFKTCGREANELSGKSYINLELTDIFNLGKFHLAKGECDPVREQVTRAVSLMTVPGIQGTLRYAFNVGTGVSTTEKAKAEGAVFAAGVLPRVHACNEDDAKIIYDNMKVGAPSTDFYAVLTAFENNYGCMGIAGWEVGAVYDQSENGGDGGYSYTSMVSSQTKSQADAAQSTGDGGGSNALAIGLGVGFGIAALVAIGLLVRMQNKKSGQPEHFVNESSDPV